jgi:hypothetical protein
MRTKQRDQRLAELVFVQPAVVDVRALGGSLCHRFFEAERNETDRDTKNGQYLWKGRRPDGLRCMKGGNSWSIVKNAA